MDIILFWILFIASLSKAIPLFPSFPEVFYYGSFLISFIWFIFRGGIRISWKYLFFISAVLFSVWLNDIPALFRVWFRVIAFFSLVFIIGPFFINDYLVRLRRLLFIRSLLILRWVVLFSFLLKFIAPDMVMGKSGFIGLTNHSMLLSPLAGICMLYGIYRFYLSETKLEQYREMIYIGVSFLVLILAGSRGALVATLAGIVFFYMRLYKYRVGQLAKIVLFFSLLVLSTSSLWWSYTERIREKMDSSENTGSLTSSRDGLWEDRIKEFKAFPIFGVGFASYNLNYIQSEHSINLQSGTVEPGSSWLFLLSSLGLYGFLSFLFTITYLICMLYKDSGTGLNGGLVGSIMTLFSVHMLVEGFVIASGSYLCFLLWLSLSEGEQILQNSNNKFL
ncbi:O-antigen ligase [Parabacteroides gordonii]|uniref:O-antigen ligase family protein n=1 Tax=Parabacteroides gordonii TaxID=574930 RepID=UPI0026EEECCA|nr:O-antigen ligase family protein [Parabacteroides gordonii]